MSSKCKVQRGLLIVRHSAEGHAIDADMYLQVWLKAKVGLCHIICLQTCQLRLVQEHSIFFSCDFNLLVGSSSLNCIPNF